MRSNFNPKNIVLIGFMGTGKTSVGKALAPKLGLRVVDVDTHIESQEKNKISAIFSEKGEAYFRALEKNAVQELSRETGLVITTGGGVVLNPANLEALRERSVVIALLASPETIYERVKGSKHRPLLQKGEVRSEIDRLYQERASLYSQADLKFDTDGQTPAQVANKIFEALKEGSYF